MTSIQYTPYTPGVEVYRLAFPPDPEMEAKGSRVAHHTYISYGLPCSHAVAYHVTNTFKSSRVYILASKAISETTEALTSLQSALKGKIVGTTIDMDPRSLWSEIMEITNECRRLFADALVVVGGGPLTDSAKVVALALANDFSTTDDLRVLPTTAAPKGKEGAIFKPPTLPVICIPSALSGTEFSNVGAAMDDSNFRKYQFLDPLRGPSLVIFDPVLTSITPEHAWLSTGMRSVDHCTEVLCSFLSNPKSDAASDQGLRMLVSGLLRTKQDPTDLAARVSCQLGVISALLAFDVPPREVPSGGSHGIGHYIPPLGVGVGETSCILLPAVCKYNTLHVADHAREKIALDLLWKVDAMKAVAEGSQLTREKANLGDMLAAFVKALALPTTLKEVGVGRDKFDQIAESSIHDPCCVMNPVPLTEKQQILDILELAAE